MDRIGRLAIPKSRTLGTEVEATDLPIIAVEASLSPYQAALRDAGFQVVPFARNRWPKAAAIIVDGLDDRLMGIETPRTSAPVIDASGFTPDQMVREIQRRILP